MNKNKVGPPFLINEEMIKTCRRLAEKGLKKAAMYRGLGISQSTWWSYQRVDRKHRNKSAKELKELNERDQLVVKLFKAFDKGHQKYVDRMIESFADTKDEKLRFQFFKQVITEYKDQNLDPDELDILLQKSGYSKVKIDKALDMLMSEDDEDENE